MIRPRAGAGTCVRRDRARKSEAQGQNVADQALIDEQGRWLRKRTSLAAGNQAGLDFEPGGGQHGCPLGLTLEQLEESHPGFQNFRVRVSGPCGGGIGGALEPEVHQPARTKGQQEQKVGASQCMMVAGGAANFPGERGRPSL